MLLKKESIEDRLNNTYLSLMSEDDFNNYCDIPTTELSFALGYFKDNLLNHSVNISYGNIYLFNIYKELIRLLNNIKENNVPYNEGDIIPFACLADHYRKELNKEYSNKILNIIRIKRLIQDMDEFYKLLKDINRPRIYLNNQELKVNIK